MFRGALARPFVVQAARPRFRCLASHQAMGYHFGPWRIQDSEVFATSEHSFAFVNLKPIVPGHVLVAPKRQNAPRFSDLDPKEVSDIWSLAQRIASVLERHHKADALTLTIQDGPAAGQTVPHLHIHVLPRKLGDFEPNDKVYDAIDNSSIEAARQRSGEPLNLDAERRPRTAEEMAAEAAELKPLFQH